MRYAFHGKVRATGQTVDGYVDAGNAEEAIARLADGGIIGVYSVRPDTKPVKDSTVHLHDEPPVEHGHAGFQGESEGIGPEQPQRQIGMLESLGGLPGEIQKEKQSASVPSIESQEGQQAKSGEFQRSETTKDKPTEQRQKPKDENADEKSGEPDVPQALRKDFSKRFLHFAEAADWLLWEAALYALWYCIVVGLNCVSSWAKRHDADESTLVFLRKYAPWGLVILIMIHEVYEILNCLIYCWKSLKASWVREQKKP